MKADKSTRVQIQVAVSGAPGITNMGLPGLSRAVLRDPFNLRKTLKALSILKIGPPRTFHPLWVTIEKSPFSPGQRDNGLVNNSQREVEVVSHGREFSQVKQ